MSLGEAVTYRIGILPERESLIRASSFWMALAMSVVVMAGGYVLMPFLLGEGRTPLWTVAQLYLLYVPFNFVALVLLATDQGRLEFSRFNTLRLMVPLIYLAGILLLWVTERVSVGWFVAANFAATALLALLALGLHRSVFHPTPSLEEAIALCGFGLRFHPVTIVLLLAGQVDVFYVIGGRHSSNSVKLLAVCQEQCEKSFLIRRPMRGLRWRCLRMRPQARVGPRRCRIPDCTPGFRWICGT